MKSISAIERAISFTKFSVALICSWPPPPTATKQQLLLFEILWWASVSSSASLLLPLLHGMYYYRADPIILAKIASIFCGVAQATIKMILCRIERDIFQDLNLKMDNFCKNANDIERNVLQRYVEKYRYGYAAYMIWCYFTTLSVISSPLYFPQTFPTHAKYPFSTDHQPLKTFIYLHQSLVGFQASAALAMDCQIALLLWYVVARFELLSMQLRDVTCERELDVCIKKHNEILRYTENINRSTRFLILTTIVMTTIGIIFGSLNLISNQPLMAKAIFFVVVLSGVVALFVSAWPADNLLHMSENISWSIYSSKWFEKRVSVQRKVLYLIMRSQRCEAIQISGFLPQLSLRYYASYLYTAFSYFTALKVLIGASTFN